MLRDHDRIVEVVLSELPDLIVLYVCGSRARGDDNASSDLDLAVLPRAPMEPARRWSLQERIASVVRGAVDLVDLRAASTVMRGRALESAQVLHEGDRVGREQFEAVALGAYARLNEERRGILEDIRARGTVHG